MKLMKATLPVLWRLTRTTSMVVGLAVMLALIVGVSSLAVAQKKQPPAGGETAQALLKEAQNTVSKATSVVGSVADAAILQLENTGGGAALDLRVQEGKAPLAVNEKAGTATNLSADTVDGKDSTDFVSATDGKAPDSDKLDGKDSTEFAAGTNGIANDSDKLDGKDSTEFAAASTGTVYTARKAEPNGVSMHNDPIDVVSTNVLPPGSYAINAKGALRNIDDDDEASVVCRLRAGELDLDRTFFIQLSERTVEGQVGEFATFPLQAVVKDFVGGPITMTCAENGDSDEVAVFEAVITAIRVGSVQ